jgi:hypothetical protein
VNAAHLAALDHITLARPANGSTTLAKIIRVQGGRIIGKDASPNVKLFRYVELPVHDLGSLYVTVTRMAGAGAIAIRAKPKGPTGNRRIHHHKDGVVPFLEVVPHRWCAFDWDGLPLDLQPCPNPKWSWEPDPLLEPWIGAQIALRRLPPPFRNVSCFWQVSAGAGFNPGFRLRTWHWLDAPVIGDELKIWLKPAIERGLVDPVTLVEAQPHYLGVHVVGGADPCPRRFGFLRLARNEVPVPDIHGIKRRQDEIERTKRAPEQRHAPRDPDEVHAYAQQRIDECLATIRAATTRHTTYTREAARARAICERYGLEWEPVKNDLIEAYESTLSAAEARERRSFSTEGVLTWLEGRTAA